MALLFRNVLLALGGGVAVALLLLNNFSFSNSLSAFLELFYTLLTQGWILKTLAFALLVGSVMELLERSGGVDAFVSFMTQQKQLVRSGRAALLVSFFIGIVIFIESSITALIAGAVGRPLCDKEGVPRAKLAYVCDATAAPVSSLILLNGWGALLLGLLTTELQNSSLSQEPLALLLESISYNFYAMSVLVVVFVFIWFGIDIGPMKQTQANVTHAVLQSKKSDAKLSYMLLPITLMILFVFFFLFVTGEGDILHGSGSSAIFYTMLSTLGVMYLHYVVYGKMRSKYYFKTAFVGIKKLSLLALVLLFAFGLGKVTVELKTGLYLASLAQTHLDGAYIGVVVFLVSALIAFSTGTSWGTFSIMIPIAFPMAVGADANVALAVGAVVSGGVFGDHCSPISDTTIISSLAAGCDVGEHVKTQLPYAIVSAVVAALFFMLLGLSGS